MPIDTEQMTVRAPEPASNGHRGPTAGPAFPVGGPTSSSWREHALTKVVEMRTLTAWVEMRTLTAWVEVRTTQEGADRIVQAIYGHLDAAEKAAEGNPHRNPWERLKSWTGGSLVERTMSNLDAAEADLLRLAPAQYLRGQMPSLQAHVSHNLPSGDPRRLRIEDMAKRARDRSFDDFEDFEQDTIVSAVRGASSEARRVVMRVRSFRNVLLVAAAFLTVAAVGIGVLGAVRPNALPLCFNPGGKVICPTRESRVPGQEADAPAAATGADVDDVVAATTSPWDVPLVQIVGLVAAAVAAAAALRSIRGTSTPYSLPVALAVLKLPTGALTAFLGLLLMRGQFVPGLSALDTSAQIIAWAVVFGYAQQLFTRLIDQRAHAVLDDVGGSLNRSSTG